MRISLLELFSLPWQVIRKGSWRYVLYVGLLVTATYFTRDFFIRSLLDYSELLLKEKAITLENYERLTLLCYWFPTLLALGPLLVGVILPIRIIALFGSCPLFELLRMTPSSLRIIYQTLARIFRSILLVLIPIGGLFAIHEFLVIKHRSEALDQIFLIICTLVVLLVTIRLIPLLMSPLVAIVGGYEGWYAITQSPQLLQGLTLLILFLLTLVAGISYAIILWVPELMLYLLPIVLWYGLTVLGCLAIGEVARVEKRQGS